MDGYGYMFLNMRKGVAVMNDQFQEEGHTRRPIKDIVVQEDSEKYKNLLINLGVFCPTSLPRKYKGKEESPGFSSESKRIMGLFLLHLASPKVCLLRNLRVTRRIEICKKSGIVLFIIFMLRKSHQFWFKIALQFGGHTRGKNQPLTSLTFSLPIFL